MPEEKQCSECKIIESTRFRSLKGNKWKEAENNNLVKVIWTEGVILCNICYMRLVKNLLRRGPKRLKVMDKEGMNEEVIDEEATDEKTTDEEVSTKVELTKAIKMIAKIFYDREHLKKEGPIYEFDEM